MVKKKGLRVKISKKFPPSILKVKKGLPKKGIKKMSIKQYEAYWKDSEILLETKKKKKVHYSKTLKGKIAELEFDRNVLNNIITNIGDLSKLDESGLKLYESIRKKIPVNHMTIQIRTVSIKDNGIGTIPYDFKL